VSGLSAWVGQKLQALGVLPTPVIVLLISTIIAVLTEVTSNTATASLMLTIVAELVNIKIKSSQFIVLSNDMTV
jgi:sodium-dependent dicarboxylate transporter 2/3/5